MFMNFVKSLLSNGFGIILATLNVCYFASEFGSYPVYPRTLVSRIFISLNLPSLIPVEISSEIIKIIIPAISLRTIYQFSNLFFVCFMILQWLFVANLSRKIAQNLQSNKV